MITHKKKLKKIIIAISLLLLVVICLSSAAFIKIRNDFKTLSNKTYQSIERSGNVNNINYLAHEPFTILLLGIDTGDLGRTEHGRSDTIILVAVNPKMKETLLVGLQRDTYTEIVGKNTQDKMNHAYAYGGITMAMDTVQNLLDIPVNHYLTMNMKGISDLVNSVGGVKVDNPFEFTYEGTVFPKGIQVLDGTEALKYSRMRYSDPDGDYGRQKRQQQIITGILRKFVSTSGVSTYNKNLDILSNNIKTDMSDKTIIKIAKNYRPALKKIETDQLKGTGFMQDGISYQKISSEELNRIQNKFKNILEIN